MKFVRSGLLIANFIMFVTFLLLLDAQGASLISEGDWEYKDLVAVILSSVSIIVTFIGIIIAVAAIWGFQTLRGMAEEKAVETSKLGSAAYLKSEAFKADLKAEIQEAIQSAARDAVQDALTPALLKSDIAPEHQVKDETWQD
jgi:hypothetical protein